MRAGSTIEELKGGPCGDGQNAHPLVRALCDGFGGALVSTSANIASEPSPRTRAELDPRIVAGVDAVETLSDHRDLSFGTAYGVAIKELRLLSRAVFVICANGVIAYEQIVKEVTHDVDFEAALGAVKACLEK